MPRKKSGKTIEQETAENYFPINQSSLKHATEKIKKESVTKYGDSKKFVEVPVSKTEKKGVEKIEKQRKAKKKTKIKGKEEKKGKYIVPKVTLKENGYELIITEKPQAALKISSALGKSTRRDIRGISYYEVERNSKKILVACAVGHLFTLKQSLAGAKLPVFELEWAPNYLVRKNDFTKRYYDTILHLIKNAGSLTIATDYDIEGEVIGMNAMRYICNQKDANRMKFSTLTTDELNEAYEKKSPQINWGQAIAGETRHYLDWFYGINLSRAIMNAIKSVGAFKIMSIGRVQGPTLNLIVQKEKSVQSFKSEPYWQVFIKIKNSHTLELKYIKDISKKDDLKKFENLKEKTCLVQTKKTQQVIFPNPPFDLTTLQTEAYRLHGITPSKTLQTAQSLYLAGLISYPRTSSQKLPDSIDYHLILKKIAKRYYAERLIKREKPVQGKKSDLAHPSIYPTGEMQILSGDEERVYNLIAKRFIALFCEDAIIENKLITATADELVFLAKGTEVKKKGWTEIYSSKLKENKIPDINGKVKISEVKIEEKETQPPKRYSPASIISELEKRDLGTKATRASILETLYERKYIEGTSIKATPLGMSLISTLENVSPIIINEVLTRNFEKEMEKISEAKKDFSEKEQKIVEKAKKAVTEIIKQFNAKEKEIGTKLLEANTKLIEKERKENTLIQCPTCKRGNLAIMYSKNTKRHFVACDAYPECKTTYSLPPNGIIKKTEKICEKCGFPILMRLTKGKKPWEFCFNPQCEKNRERIEKYKERN